MLTFINILLCSLAALTLAAQAGSLRGAIPLWLAGFGSGVVLFETALGPLPLTVEVEQNALLILLMAAFLLVSPGRMLWFMPAGGLWAVLWTDALQTQGFPPLLAWLLAVSSLLAALHCGRTQKAFCTPVLLQDVLVILVVVGSGAALVPGLIGGWGTGLGISAVERTAVALPDASSALAVSALCFLCGAAYAFLFKTHLNKRRKSL